MKIKNSPQTSMAEGKGAKEAQKAPPKKAFADFMGGKDSLQEKTTKSGVAGELEQEIPGLGEGEENLEEDGLKLMEERVEIRESERQEVAGLRGEERIIERQEKWQSHREEALATRREVQEEHIRDEKLQDERILEDDFHTRKSPLQSKDKDKAFTDELAPTAIDGDIQASEPGVQAQNVEEAEAATPTQQIAREIVEAIHIGHDSHARKIVLVDVNIPGKGNVRIRVRRQGDHVEVRMRTQDQELARTLRAGRDELREAGRQKGLNFSTIDVVS